MTRRILTPEEAARELEIAHNEVGQAALEWLSAGCPAYLPPTRTAICGNAAAGLRNAILAWKEAGQDLHTAMRKAGG